MIIRSLLKDRVVDFGGGGISTDLKGSQPLEVDLSDLLSLSLTHRLAHTEIQSISLICIVTVIVFFCLFFYVFGGFLSNFNGFQNNHMHRWGFLEWRNENNNTITFHYAITVYTPINSVWQSDSMMFSKNCFWPKQLTCWSLNMPWWSCLEISQPWFMHLSS